MRNRALGWSLGLSLSGLGALAGCYAFDEPQLGVCGNAIIEADEDCDDADEEDCRECHLVCTPHVSTTGCPPTRVCGNDGQCRAPSGEFAAEPISLERSGARWLAAGDLDGDHLDDLVAQFDGSLDAVHLAPQQTIVLEAGLGRAAVGDLDEDGRDEVVVASFSGESPGSLSLLREQSQADETRAPMAAVLPTLRTGGLSARLLAVPPRDRILELAGPDDTRGWHRAAQAAEPLEPALAVEPELLAIAIAMGDLDDGADPCADTLGARTELALATVGATAVSIVSTCGATDPFELVARSAVALPAGRALGPAGSFFVEINADGQLDLITQSDSETVLVAFGVADGTFHSAPEVPASAGDGDFATTPLWAPTDAAGTLLAVADFDADGTADLVTERGFVLAPQTCVAPCLIPWSEPLETARAVDLNADGSLDLVGSRERVLEVRLGDSEPGGFRFTTPHEFALGGTGTALADGDFNGDTVDDLALIERGDEAEPGDGDRVTVLYGGALDDWHLQSFGPFAKVESLVVDGADTLVVRLLDAQGRAAGAFIRPGEAAVNFGMAVHQPVMVQVDQAKVVAAIALDPELGAERIVHFGFVSGALSPYDTVRGAVLDGMLVGSGVGALVAAIELDDVAGVEELVVLGTTTEGGTVWTMQLDVGTGVWSQRDRFVFGPGFAQAPLSLEEDEMLASGGPGSSMALGDVDGDGDADILATIDEPLPRAVVLINHQGQLSATTLRETNHFMAFELTLLARWHADTRGVATWLVGGEDGVGLATVDLELERLLITDVSGAHASALTAADVDGDGLLDLAIATDRELRIHLAQERLGGD